MSNVKPTYTSPTDGRPKPVDTSADSIAVKAVYVQTSATPDTAVGISRDLSDNLVLTDSVTGSKTLAQIAGGGGLTNWTEAVSTAAPNATVPVDSFTATNAATNVDSALVAKGSGASLAQVPDNTSAAGNKRGTYATDWQKSRGASTQVASGAQATIGGGSANTASGTNATVAGGYGNNASGNYSTIAGGNTSIASGVRATVGGGINNNASGDDSIIAGGTQNTASGTVSTVAGGQNNQATNSFSSVVGGNANTASGIGSGALSGETNTASALDAVVAGGNTNKAQAGYAGVLAGNANEANGNYSAVVGGATNKVNTGAGAYGFIGGGTLNALNVAGIYNASKAAIVGGESNAANAEYAAIGGGYGNVVNAGSGGTIPGGYLASTRGITGKFAYASRSASSGNQQMGIHVTRASSTGNVSLTADGAAIAATAAGTNINILGPTTMYAVLAYVVCNKTGAGEFAAWRVEGLVRRGLTAATTTLVGSPTVTSIGVTGMAGYNCTLAVDTTLGGVYISGTGTVSTALWAATMYTTELGGVS